MRRRPTPSPRSTRSSSRAGAPRCRRRLRRHRRRWSRRWPRRRNRRPKNSMTAARARGRAARLPTHDRTALPCCCSCYAHGQKNVLHQETAPSRHRTTRRTTSPSREFGVDEAVSLGCNRNKQLRIRRRGSFVTVSPQPQKGICVFLNTGVLTPVVRKHPHANPEGSTSLFPLSRAILVLKKFQIWHAGVFATGIAPCACFG